MNYPSLALLIALGCAPELTVLAAETPAPSGEAAGKERALLAPAQLEELLSPIALYPDPLIAIILPASTFPTDIVLAARYLTAGGNPESLESQSWDDSVKALARYPEVMKWMDQNLAWTKAVGAAFVLQPADVLTCTQRLRTAARAAGNLNDSPEQKVVVERETIRIVPARPEVIYVPVYDPAWVYRPREVNFYHPRPLIRFTTAYRTGSWLSYHCDWGYSTVVVVSRPYRVNVWQNHPRWVCPPPDAGIHHVWRPGPTHTRTVFREPVNRVQQRVAQPASPTQTTREGVRERAKPAAPSVTQIPATSTSQVAPRPTQSANSRRIEQSSQTNANPAAPARAERADLRASNLVAPPARTTLPPPVASPSAPSAGTGLGAARRIQSITTSPASTRISAPARETPPAVTPSRRARETRDVSAAPSFERSTSRAANQTARSPSTSRMAAPTSAISPMTSPETEAAVSRRGR